MITIVCFPEDKPIVKGKIFYGATYVGDVRGNDLTDQEYENLDLRLDKEKPTMSTYSVEEFHEFIKETKGLLIFKDLNGNFGTNFNETLGEL
jgi:hypothetical protein